METVDNITYTERHNMAARVIHHGENTLLQIYTNTALENKEYKLHWDIVIHRDKTIVCNRIDQSSSFNAKKKEKTTYLSGISVRNDHYIETKYVY